MKHNIITSSITAILLITGTATTSNALANEKKIEANDLVEMFEKLGGKYPGFRKAHAKGLCALGTFMPAPNKHFSGAALLSNGELPVSMRFSLGGTNPNSDEKSPGTRGMGMQIKLPNGALHTFTGNNFPVFAGKDPETFYGFLSTLLPDENGKPDPAKTVAFIQQNPSVQANVMWNKTAKTAASFANTAFFGLHTFYFDQPNGQKTKFRWNIQPSLGVKTLEKAEAAKMPNEFLADTFAQQLKDETVRFTIMASLGEAEDSVIDPSQQWPNERPQVILGTVTVNASGGDACKNINFDPNMMSAGFTPSADPVLKMRSPAYAISFGKRLSGQ
ncbi:MULTISPECIES: catalase family peroxidase [unclassified Colwellia]|uniref:catalase family peroxidase n=1 Tax=unclassified Colwellia TaxID=196834 RepID=UPI0015F60DCE|nr:MULTISPECIES: catalase family peroxidase [unclassified Colwellia]MBA6233004.1 catalase family peroxidase [Colwellia sp. MB02u-7]MBA6236682.1 catalase family peroxidase [Colwellia sp. MB02u-11]MBA6255874.1 catalase family peroxidase [Colwellia sp. MB3u-28]MBA6262016.1 catalase family peroxidase [Colwellia sp. MB3u-41]MBA6298984.1 catalase family peroxidase [Colwellia sp. MB3u-22]